VAALVAKLLNARSQAAMLTILETEAPHERTRSLASEIKAHIPVLEDHLRANRAREAIATVLAMLFLDADHAISCMRRDGVLRASRYGYKGALIGRVGKAALAIRHLMTPSSDCLAYLESIIALSKLAANAGALHEEMVRTVRARRTVVLKTVLVIVNSLFYHGWLNDPNASSLDSRRYSSEEYAEAASLILATYASLFPIDDRCCIHVDVTALGTGAVVYHRLLLAAIRITKFREAELTIDGLPYRAELDGQTVTISSICPDIERSVRLGYIQSQNQAMIRVAHLQEAEPAISVRDLIDGGFERGSFQQLTELVEEPVRRLRLRLPAVPEVFDALFACDYLFRDELEKLLILDVDNFGAIDDLLFGITERVTSLDIFKVQRYFNFIGSVYQKRLAEIEDEAERGHLTLTSTLLIVSHDGLIEQMRLIFGDEAKCREIIALLTMDAKESHLDLQYRPFVNLGKFYAIAPHVVAASNLVRNTVVANRLRSAAIGPKDQMVQSLTDALQLAGFMVQSDFKTKVDGRELELDIVAWRDGSLFLFECKNAYHPCSVHEMRNSWDHIRIARKQLDVRRDLLADASNLKQLFAKLGWNAGTLVKVHTGIVIANRVFHGAALNGHPVRQAHELINVLTSGRIVGHEDSLSFWSGPEFQTADLVAYLSGDSIAARQLAALDPHRWSYAMGYRTLVFSSYVLDLVELDRKLRERYGPPIPGGRTQASA
jgi:hypothetical protein